MTKLAVRMLLEIFFFDGLLDFAHVDGRERSVLCRRSHDRSLATKAASSAESAPGGPDIPGQNQPFLWMSLGEFFAGGGVGVERRAAGSLSLERRSARR